MIPDTGQFVVDSTSHQLKFASFQQMYFDDGFTPEYGIMTRKELKNSPITLEGGASTIAGFLGLKRKN